MHRILSDLVSSNVSDLSVAAPENETCVYQSAWLGYYGNGTLGTGNWTDGSQVDYNGFFPIGGAFYWTVRQIRSLKMSLPLDMQ